MATKVEKRYCKRCKTKYRTKVRKGKDTRPCPVCIKDPIVNEG